ncbi:uncharacterized protein [Dermacentor andersoni]|uniref:uncharacterized protein isoform X2 n=1 Tax=Dermacentor andersoni TaxID=34620 RepID=UPI002417C750|nr:uncharacterized protein LOC126528337 isoform X2 [Dermacentor andersoni]
MKALLCQLCILTALLALPCAGFLCNGESYPELRRQCLKGLQQKVKAVLGDLTENCKDFADFATCLRDSWKYSHCDNVAGAARHNDTLLKRIEKAYFPDCLNGSGGPEKDCHPGKALQKFMSCGNRFYDSAVRVFQNHATVSLTSICPEVDAYDQCAHDTQQEARCSSGYEMAPHIKFIADGVTQRYHLLCSALKQAAFQKSTTACNRQRFINDMFLCGFHFANIMDIARKDTGINPCTYIERYRKCHNTSLETYGCAPPDQLYKDAEKFFEFLTQKFAEKCRADSKAGGVAMVSRLTDKDGLSDAEKSCDGYRFIGQFFRCAKAFMNTTSGSRQDTAHICRAVRKYQRCIDRARQTSHCQDTVELNGHLDSMEQLMLASHESLCSARGSEEGSGNEKGNR